VLGAAIGLFVGLSKSPIVGEVLPLLFALIAGSGGLYLVYKEASRDQFKAVGISFLAFIPACAVFALLGALLRLPTACLSLLGSAYCPGASTIERPADLRAHLLGVELAAYLQVFGATPEDSRSIADALSRFASDASAVVRIRGQARLFLRALDDLVSTIPPSPTEVSSPTAVADNNFLVEIGRLREVTRQLANMAITATTLDELGGPAIELVALADLPAVPLGVSKGSSGLEAAIDRARALRGRLTDSLYMVPAVVLDDVARRSQRAKEKWPSTFKAITPDVEGLYLERRKEKSTR
jgi:hypothetical protein